MSGKKWVDLNSIFLPTIFLPSNFLRGSEDSECKGTAGSCEIERSVWLHRVATPSKGRSSVLAEDRTFSFVEKFRLTLWASPQVFVGRCLS